MIIVQKTFTATNTDALSGTDLAQIPAFGQLDIFLASTQNDSTITITGPGNEPIVRGGQIVQRTNGMADSESDIPFSLVVSQGGKYVINLTVVTAATIGLIAIFRDYDEIE